MSRNLDELFTLFAKNELPNLCENVDLFGFSETPALSHHYEKSSLDLLSNYFFADFNISHFNEPARILFELSYEAFDILIHAWMSELPIETQIINFGRRIISLAQCECSFDQKRRLAAKAVTDCGDENTLTVTNASEKVRHEARRMMGLLRFSPKNDIYIAHFTPDHLIIPALGNFFAARFMKTSWAIIDDKRKLCLYSLQGEKPHLCAVPSFVQNEKISTETDEWEELWRHYFKTINNESRENKGLQRQFMPKRYWKYLTEL